MSAPPPIPMPMRSPRLTQSLDTTQVGKGREGSWAAEVDCVEKRSNRAMSHADNKDMSYARCILPGQTWMVTRRCLERRMFFRPDKAVGRLFEYCLAEAAAHYGVLVHGYVLMSNHYHVVLSDPRGELPWFMARLNRHLALGISALRGHRGVVWDAGGSYSAVALESEEALVDKLAYVYCNPMSARLVTCSTQWPGALSSPEAMEGHGTATERPHDLGLFRKMSDKVCLQLSAPPNYALRVRTLVEAVRSQIARRTEELEQEGRPVLGAQRVLSTPWTSSPGSAEPPLKRNPRFAAVTREALRAAARKLREFRRAYREAWHALTQGLSDVLFPHGTWLLVKQGLVRVDTET